jgi:hypothetical protein
LSATAAADAKAAADADANVVKAKARLDKANNDVKVAAAASVLTAGAASPALIAAQTEQVAAVAGMAVATAEAAAAHDKANQSAAAAASEASSHPSQPVHVTPGTATPGGTYVPPPRTTPPPSGTYATGHVLTPGQAQPTDGAAGTSGSAPLPNTSQGGAAGTTASGGPVGDSSGSGAAGAAHGSAAAQPPGPTSPAGHATDPSAELSTAGHGSGSLRDFPTIPNLVRKSFVSTQSETAETLNTDYSSKLGPSEVAAQYETQLTSAGWEEIERSQSGDSASGTLFVRRQWKRQSQNADFRINQSTNGSDFFLSITQSGTGILSSAASELEGTNVDAQASGGSPNDQGERDPANFPRITSSVRKSFQLSGTARTPHEDAVYRARVTLQQAEAFYVNHLLQADWEETQRREVGDAEDYQHSVYLSMKLGGREVTIQLKAIQPKVTEITIQSVGASR